MGVYEDIRKGTYIKPQGVYARIHANDKKQTPKAEEVQESKPQTSFKPVNTSEFIKNKFLTPEEIDKRIYTLPDGTMANKNDYTKEEQDLLMTGKFKINPNYDPSSYFSQKVISANPQIMDSKKFEQQRYDNANALGKAQIIAGKVGNTAKDIVGSAGVGAISAAEGLANTGIAAVGNIANLVGAKDAGNYLTNMVKDDITGELQQKLDTSTKSGYGRYTPSILGMDVRNISQEGARMLTAGVGGLPGFIGSAIGGNTQEALNEGQSLGRASIYGGITGTIEGATEKLFDTFKLLGGGALDKFIPKNVVARLATAPLGEYVEEWISQGANPFVKMATYDADIKNPVGSWDNFKEWLSNNHEAGWQGFVMGLVLQGGSDISNAEARQQYKNEVTKAVDKIKGLTQQQKQEAINKLAKESENSKVQIEEVMQNYKQNSQYDKYIPQTQEQNIKLPTSQENVARGLPTNGFQGQGKQTILPTQKIQETVNSAKIVGISDFDVKKAQDMHKMLQSGSNLKFYDSKNVPAGVDSRAINANGFYKDGTLWINKDSKRQVEKILGHELTHHLENTEEYSNFAKTIFDSNLFYDYITSQGYDNVEQFKENLRQRGYSDKDMDYEMVSMFAEDNLFDSQEKINRLARENRTLAQKILNWLSDMKTKLVGTSQEKELLRIENMYRKALEQARNVDTTSTDAQYSYSGEVGLNNLKENRKNMNFAQRRFVNELESNYNTAVEMDNQGATNEQILKDTGWFKADGKWRWEIPDTLMRLKPDIQLENGVSYDLADILQHDLLFMVYPDLMTQQVVIDNDMNGKGKYNTITKNIKLKVADRSKGNIELTLLHEVQHAIQDTEGFEGGTSPLGGKLRYYEHKGEIEAADTARRLLEERKAMRRGETFDREKVAPELSKENPEHPGLKDYLASDKQTKIRDNIYKRFKGGAGNETESFDIEDVELENNETNNETLGQNNSRRRVAGREPAFSLPETDNQGRKLTSEQQEFFKDSKVRDENGNLQVMYHGTNGEFTKFNKGTANGWLGKGIYLTTNKDYAKKQGKKTMAVYANLNNPFISKSNDPFSFLSEVQKIYPEADSFNVAEVLQKNGYDGIIYTHWDENVGKMVNVFEPNQIKDISNTKPTSNPDIRFSLNDSEGRTLSKEQQEFFKDSKVRDENGNLQVMYHGTPNGTFTEFNTGTYFTSNKKYADQYQSQGASSLSYKRTAEKPSTYEVYLNIKKPFDTRNSREKEIFMNEFHNKWSGTPLSESGLPDWTDGMDLQEFIEENGYDYDGLILDEGAIGGYGDEIQSRGLSYVVFNPEQVKNVDNTKPTENADIRFSLNEPVEETKDLVALHNLSADSLNKSLDLGGFPVPSIAITKAKNEYGDFGDITLVFGKDSIDPDNPENEVYTRDIYSKTIPRVKQKITPAKFKELKRRFEPYFGEVNDSLSYKSESKFTDTNVEDLANDLAYEAGMKLAYLKETGKLTKLEPVYSKKRWKTGDVTEEILQEFSEKYPETTEKSLTYDETMKYEEAVKDIIYKIYLPYDEKIARGIADETGFRHIDNFLQDVRNFNNKNYERTELDIYATRDKLKELVGNNDKDFINWIREQISPYYGEKYHDANGKKIEPNLSALTEYMKKGSTRATQKTMVYGMGNAVAESSKKLNSIKSIKEYSQNIKDSKTVEEIKEAVQKLDETVREDIARSRITRGESFFDVFEDYYKALAQYMKNGKGLEAAFRKNYFDELTSKQIEEVKYLAQQIQATPVSYFEAKPQRAVEFDEVLAAVVPKDTDASIKSRLKEKGVNVIEYDSKVEGDRLRAVNSVENAKFSLNAKEDNTSNARALSRYAQTLQKKHKDIPEHVNLIQKEIDNGNFMHEVIRDKRSLNYAENYIKDNGFEDAVKHWDELMKRGKAVDKDELALGQTIYNLAVENKDTRLVMKMASDLVQEYTEIGRNLQSATLLRKMTPDGRLYALERSVQKINQDLMQKFDDFENIQIPEELADNLLNSETQKQMDKAVEQIQEYIASQIPATWQEKLNSWRYLSMLGNPRTHIRNIVGNAVFVPAVEIKNKLAQAGELLIPKDQRTKATLTKKDSKLLQYAENDFDNNQETIRGESKYDIKAGIQEKRQIYSTKALEFARKGNFNLLEQEDKLFLKFRYKRAFAGALKARGITIEQLRENSPETVRKVNEIRSYAINEAQKATYRDASIVASMISRGKRKLLNSANQSSGASKLGYNLAYLGAEGIMPFTKTPINIVKRGIEYSPAGLLNGIKDAVFNVRNGKVTAAQAIDKIAAGTTGTAIAGLGFFLASMGLVNGGEEEKDKEQALKELKGYQNYSLNVDGKSYTIDWTAPSSIPFFIGVELYNSINSGDETAYLNALKNITEPVVEMSMLQGINDTLKTMGEDDAIGNIVAKTLTNYLGQYNPTLLGQIARSIDPVRRTTYVDKNIPVPAMAQRFIQQQAAKIPGVSRMLPTYKDQFGQEQLTDGVINRIVQNFTSPGYLKDIKEGVVEKGLTELYEKTGETSVIPSYASKSLTKDGEKINLTAKQYDTYAKTRGELSKKGLEGLFNSSYYKNLTDKQKVKIVEGIYDYANNIAKSKVIDGYELEDNEKKIQKLQNSGLDFYKYIMLKKTADADGNNYTSNEELENAIKKYGLTRWEDIIKEKNTKKTNILPTQANQRSKLKPLGK
jgi:heme oxygenase